MSDSFNVLTSLNRLVIMAIWGARSSLSDFVHAWPRNSLNLKDSLRGECHFINKVRDEVPGVDGEHDPLVEKGHLLGDLEGAQRVDRLLGRRLKINRLFCETECGSFRIKLSYVPCCRPSPGSTYSSEVYPPTPSNPSQHSNM